jgi:hypothetical protein
LEANAGRIQRDIEKTLPRISALTRHSCAVVAVAVAAVEVEEGLQWNYGGDNGCCEMNEGEIEQWPPWIRVKPVTNDSRGEEGAGGRRSRKEGGL